MRYKIYTKNTLSLDLKDKANVLRYQLFLIVLRGSLVKTNTARLCSSLDL